MAIFTSPQSFQQNARALLPRQLMTQSAMGASEFLPNAAHSSHPSFFHLVLLVFEAVLEVVCVSLPGYIAARQGMFNADAQKLVANLNVMLFTPCLIFTKLGSQLTAEKLTDLAIIPLIFVVQTLVSYICAFTVSRCCGFKKRAANFVTAMAVFGNSNSLPISLVISLSQTLKGLHWDRIPNDNDDEVAARGILYLLIFQQLGQLVRWSWGYHVLLAPRDHYLEEGNSTAVEVDGSQERYRDDPDQALPDEPLIQTRTDTDDDMSDSSPLDSPRGSGEFHSGDQTPVTTRTYSYTKLSPQEMAKGDHDHASVLGPPPRGPFLPRQSSRGDILCFPNVEVPDPESHETGIFAEPKSFVRRVGSRVAKSWGKRSQAVFQKLPTGLQKSISVVGNAARRFVCGVWAFMNPPLWAMLVSIVVASVPSLQRLFFNDGTFVNNSVTRAIGQNGQVAVPLILVVLGANLERNTLPEEAQQDLEHPKEERKLIIASLVSRMLLPTLIMAPFLALLAKYVPVSIVDDPIFIIVCFLLTGAPSALQLAQICQINNVYVGAMSKLLFQSYVVWILPSTLALVMCALEVVEWATGVA